MINYKVKAKKELVDEMINPIISSLEESDANKKAVYQINLALEEIFVNIVNYAYKDDNGYVDISYDINKSKKQILIIIKDKGKAFNPLEKEDPTLSGTAQERKIGGLGIYIVKNIVDDIKYQRVNKENILKIIKNI